MLGYRNMDGKLTVEPAEADTVRLIFSEYLSGKGQEAIMNDLNRRGIPTRKGGKWCKSSVSRILQNYAYTGKENATVAMDQGEYNRKYDGYAARFEDAKQKMAELQALRTARIFEADAIECFMGTLLRDPELPMEYSPELWNSLVDHVTIYRDERLVFAFRNGQEIAEIL